MDDDADELVTTVDRDGKELRFSGVCPHFGGPLSFDQRSNQFRCPWHNWIFDRSGKCVNRMVSCTVKIY